MVRLKRPRVRYDAALVVRDMAEKGWMAKDLARASRVCLTTVLLFIAGRRQTEKTGGKIAYALGYMPARYILSVDDEEAAC